MATTKPRTCRRTIVLAADYEVDWGRLRRDREAVYGRTTADYLVEVEA